MRRVKIVGTAVSAVLLAAAAVILIWFPGLFTCLHMKWKYDNLDRKVPQYETQSAPADFQQLELRGLRISVPADYAPSKKSNSALSGPDGKTRVFVTATAEALELVSDLNPEYDPFAAYDFTEAALRQYFQTVGRPYRGPAGSALLFYCKDRLSVWDGLRLRGSDRAVFAELCEIKNGSWDYEESEKMTIPGGIAYISSGMLGGGAQTVSIFSETDGKQRMVTVTEPDEQLKRQIISSLSFSGTG
ncbi:MAG: hypothetical protein IK107_06105 [Oscillospiraceae bacterium]|nr:hypothetical protein [Oscillospiraceae bacterium]